LHAKKQSETFGGSSGAGRVEHWIRNAEIASQPAQEMGLDNNDSESGCGD
jgi:hypothetical protein